MDRYANASDEVLLASSSEDRAAFGEFYERHERAVLGYFGAATRDPELAADLTAETFAGALGSVATFDPARGLARVWLFGIARYVFAASLRRGRVESEARRKLGLEALVIAPHQLDAIAGMIERESDQIVEEWLAQLPAEHAEALRARVVDGLEYEEIAGRLRCSEALVRQRVSRGLGRLRRRVVKEAA